jgi:hypothetical protein
MAPKKQHRKPNISLVLVVLFWCDEKGLENSVFHL